MALSQYSSMELSLAVAQLASDTALRYRYFFLSGNDRQLWPHRRAMDLALFVNCLYYWYLVVALCGQSLNVTIGQARRKQLLVKSHGMRYNGIVLTNQLHA